MNDLLHIIIAIMVILIGKHLLAKFNLFTEKRRERTIRVAMDAEDNDAFISVIRSLKLPGFLGVRYNDSRAVIVMFVIVRSESYNLFMNELKKIPRIEVA